MDPFKGCCCAEQKDTIAIIRVSESKIKGIE